jgi:hypothetical protein
MGNWLNSDGLYIKYGTDEGVSTADAGEYGTVASGEHVIEINLDLTALTSTEETILNDTVFVPKDALITWVEYVVLETADGANATMDIGLVGRNRAADIDADGLLVAVPETRLDDAAGLTIRFWETSTSPASETGSGALIGTAPTVSGYICGNYDTAAFTAGRVLIRVAYLPSFTEMKAANE